VAKPSKETAKELAQPVSFVATVSAAARAAAVARNYELEGQLVRCETLAGNLKAFIATMGEVPANVSEAFKALEAVL